MDKKQIAKMIDHTLLKPATKKQIETLCEEAKAYHFASVCVNPCHVKDAAALLDGTDVKVCTVIGFPLGENATKAKVDETKIAVKQGATEIDMVMNQSWAKSNAWGKVQKEIAAIKKACGELTLKVILETCNLSDKQIVAACKASVAAGADYVKTSTGFGKGGATVEAVALMHDTVATAGVKVKASGGVHNYDEAMAMINAGASRIGASCGVEICKD
ncbi:MAG: deoxyribose-phosphate aldolase [Corallococcus sp.]|nr:deoxyribose-phosphate aldolase [Corallococcus sp.]MCM1359231.1 deoxyribose-phosphate aldolase [Corallococcus sp.]MCM1394622.1 deoxyribose-phosphate aldolase [Corallococcus sp.]